MKPFFYFIPDTYFAQCEAWGFNLRIRSTCLGLALDNRRGSWWPSLSITLGGWVSGEGGWRRFFIMAGKRRVGFTFPMLRRAA